MKRNYKTKILKTRIPKTSFWNDVFFETQIQKPSDSFKSSAINTVILFIYYLLFKLVPSQAQVRA